MSNVTRIPHRWEGTVDDVIRLLQTQRKDIQGVAISIWYTIDEVIDSEISPIVPNIQSTYTTLPLIILQAMVKDMELELNYKHWQLKEE